MAVAKQTRKKKPTRSRATSSGAARSSSKRKAGKKKADASGTGLTPETRRALGYLALICFCGLSALALYSYSPLDPSIFRRSTATEIANWCGRLGAVWADLLFQVLGYAAWWILPFAGWVSLRFTRRSGGRMGWLFAGLAGTWWSGLLLGLLFFEEAGRDYPAGGIVGQASAAFLLEHIGTAGAYIVVVLLLAIASTIIFGIDWEALANRGVGAVESGAPQAAGLLRRGLTGAAARGVGLGRDGWERVSAGFARGEEPRRSRRSRRRDEELRDEDLRDEELRDDEPHSDAPYDDEGYDASDEELDGAPVGPLSIPIHPEPLPIVGRAHTEWGYNASAPMAELDDVTQVAARQLVEVREDFTTSPSVFDVPDPRLDPIPSGIAPPTRPSSPGRPTGERRSRASEPGARPAERGSFIGRTGLSDEPDEENLYDAPPVSPRAASPVEEEPLSASKAVAIRQRYEVVEDIGDQMPLLREPRMYSFDLPTLELLDEHERPLEQLNEEELRELAGTLEQKLRDFKIEGEVTAIQPGPVITTLEYLPAPGIKLSKIAGLSDDIAMAMRAIRVRIVAPIPGRGVVGVEIPNKDRQVVWYRDLVASRDFRDGKRALPMVLGKTVEGRPFVSDLAKMPHLLVGGTTGSGKSVGINAMLVSLLYTRTPEELRMILIDPKMLEFEPYHDIPHLLHPVVTEPRLASAALKWACTEMDERYRKLARWGTRNIASYNKKVERELADWTPEKARRYAPRNWPEGEALPRPEKMSYIVIVIDELADLMMVAAKDVEESIVRLAQKARACGIHLIVATQRPSVDVITGLIKANMPSRIAYQVRSRTDGRTILDQNGAENLLGKGDMLFLPPGVSALQRLHGPLVEDEEVIRVCDFLRAQGEPDYSADISVEDEGTGTNIEDDEYDEYYDIAVQIVTEAGKASTSMIQRRLKIGYNRAARIIEIMEREGVVGPADGARPRKVLVGSA